MEHDELQDLPEHTQIATLKAAFRADRKQRALAALEAAKVQPIGDVTPTLQNDENRRALFLALTAKHIMEKGATWTAAHLTRVYKMRRKTAYAVIKESRREMAAEMATQTDELRAVAEARLENLMRKADEACDLTNYGRALKEWMRLHGLYRQDDTTMGDFAALMRKVTAEADATVLDADFEVKDAKVVEEEPQAWALPEHIEEETEQ